MLVHRAQISTKSVVLICYNTVLFKSDAMLYGCLTCSYPQYMYLKSGCRLLFSIIVSMLAHVYTVYVLGIYE